MASSVDGPTSGGSGVGASSRAQETVHRDLSIRAPHFRKKGYLKTKGPVTARATVPSPLMALIGLAHFGEPMAFKWAQSISTMSLVATVVADEQLEV